LLPLFDQHGNLPVGIYPITWAELVARFGWNERRLRLLDGLRQAAGELRAAGCTVLYLGGSFASSKNEPVDFDGCWERTGINVDRLDPVLLDSSNTAVQKAKYGGELYPFKFAKSPNEFDFFQLDREGHVKGLLALDLSSLPMQGVQP